MSDSSGGTHEDDAASPARGASRDEALDAARRARLNQLLEATARGDQAAFAELYRLTSSHLFALIVRMVHDRGEAEDLLQDVFTTAWRRADSFDAARGGAMTWLVTLARNRAIDRLRQHHEAQLDDPVAEALPDESPTPAALVEASEERQRLERCLKQLERTQRGAIREAFFSGATYSELAERMSVPLGTLKSWIRRSLIQLKTCLEQ
ncbi:sigma-70 family RNA polymerase sigma factor [Paraburkholderia sp. J12]|uniref:sigma-70 family RNA polymerase sigma factor n=1 Tax=Paraburkholderia sp. J12 TaxID=2805432 RepID=UPI002ABDCEBF|nr:sigma-70 family RNA polymerase sigma factor [Paraburkholderia sp. J12]